MREEFEIFISTFAAEKIHPLDSRVLVCTHCQTPQSIEDLNYRFNGGIMYLNCHNCGTSSHLLTEMRRNFTNGFLAGEGMTWEMVLYEKLKSGFKKIGLEEEAAKVLAYLTANGELKSDGSELEKLHAINGYWAAGGSVQISIPTHVLAQVVHQAFENGEASLEFETDVHGHRIDTFDRDVEVDYIGQAVIELDLQEGKPVFSFKVPNCPLWEGEF